MAKKKYHPKPRTCSGCGEIYKTGGTLCTSCRHYQNAIKLNKRCAQCGEIVTNASSQTCRKKACLSAASKLRNAARKALGVGHNDIYLPSAEEIKAACWEIQSRWSEEEERLHRGLTAASLDNAVELKVFHVQLNNEGTLICT